MDVAHGGGRDVAQGGRAVEREPRVERVERRPADEELDDDDEQHADDASLGAHAPLLIRVTHVTAARHAAAIVTRRVVSGALVAARGICNTLRGDRVTGRQGDGVTG